MRRRDQQGATLVIVLALVAFLCLLIPAALGLGYTNSQLTPQIVRVDRAKQYDATSALDAAIRQAQITDWIGRSEDHGGECPDLAVQLDDASAVLNVECEPRSEFCEDRTITFRVLDATDQHRASANVLFGHRDGGPVADILNWSSDPTSPVTPAQFVACPPPAPHEDIAAVTAWGEPSTSLESANTQWRAQVPLTVVGDVLEEPVAGAAITVQVEYLHGGVWESAADLTGTTDDDGEWQAESALVAVVGSPPSPVERIRFTISEVAAGDLLWDLVPERDVVEVVAPAVVTVASIAPAVPPTGTSANSVYAQFVIEVRDNRGEPVPGAVVEVQRRTWTPNGGWQVDNVALPGPPANPTFATGADGRVTIRSRNYSQSGNQGNRVRDVEFTVTNVTATGLTWSGATWAEGTLTANIPF